MNNKHNIKKINNMKTTTLFNYTNKNYGYYQLTIKETDKSIIIEEYTNTIGNYDKTLKYKKNNELLKDIKKLTTSNNIQRDITYFVYNYITNNNSYWHSYKKVE